MPAKLEYRPGVGWLLYSEGLYLRNEDGILPGLGGRKIRTHLWRFPGVYLYASRLLSTFRDAVTVTEESKSRFQDWGFEPKDCNQNNHPKWEKLLRHQKEAVTYLVSSPLHGALLALSPGLGKSACSIVAAQVLGFQRVLIISPLTLLPTWVSQCREWGGITVSVLRSRDPIPLEGWVVTNYDTVTRNTLAYTQAWDLVILDESVLVKNRKTLRFKSISKVCQRSGRVWELSGLPITRSVEDLYSQFKLLEPNAFLSYWRFIHFFCNIKETVWGKEIIGSKHEIDFKSEFRDLMFVRNLREVVDLPKVLYETYELEMDKQQKDVYSEIQYDLIEALQAKGLSMSTRIAKLTRLQQAVSSPVNLGTGFTNHSCKVDAILELLDTESLEVPMLIWVHWRGTGNQLLEGIQNLSKYRAAYIHGGTPEKKRHEYLSKYQGGELDILVLSSEVGKYGLNSLICTHTMVYVDRTFSMDTFVQSVHRVERMGLKHSPVVVTLKCPGTIDDLVEMNLAGKVLDLSKLTDSDLLELLLGLGFSETTKSLLRKTGPE